MLSSQEFNFIFYNTLGVAAFMVCLIYGVYLFTHNRDKNGLSFHFGVGIFLATLSKLIERVYYGTLRGIQLKTGDNSIILSSEWIITFIAVLGITGFVWHIKTITKMMDNNNFFIWSVCIIFVSLLLSLFYVL